MDKIEQEQYTDDIKLAGESLKAMEQANLSYDANAVLGMAIGKLRRYEDTGLTPQEIIEGKLLTGWIPVEERLPEQVDLDEDGDFVNPVMITYKSFHDKTPMCKGGLAVYCEDGVWRWLDDAYSVRGMEEIMVEIIAWMPLPEPYKGE